MKKQLTKGPVIGYPDPGSVSLNLCAQRRPQTKSEAVLFQVMLKQGLSPKPQYRFLLHGRMIAVDFGFPEARLAVECDGRHHYSGDQRQRDLERDRLLWRYGWRVVRFRDSRVLADPDECVRVLLDEMLARL